MINWQTLVSIDRPSEQIGYQNKIMLFGSCFAEEIGARLISVDFSIITNPFGISYNPASIAHCIERLVSKRAFVEDELFCDKGLWRSFMHSSKFSERSKEDFLEKSNLLLDQSALHFEKSDWIVVTLGTSYIYKLLKDSHFAYCSSYLGDVPVVNNCHKLLPSNFERERLSEESVFNYFDSLLSRFPEKRWVFTVSPIRHWKDGAHNNQLSKAILLLATERLRAAHKNIFYFPAYEIVMDELRDYRFYAGDMLHLSREAVDYICERFLDLYIDPKSLEITKMVEKLNRMDAHRALLPDSEEYNSFLKKRDEIVKKIDFMKKNIILFGF